MTPVQEMVALFEELSSIQDRLEDLELPESSDFSVEEAMLVDVIWGPLNEVLLRLQNRMFGLSPTAFGDEHTAAYHRERERRGLPAHAPLAEVLAPYPEGEPSTVNDFELTNPARKAGAKNKA